MRTPTKRLITAGLAAALLGTSVFAVPATSFAVTANDVYVGVDASYTEAVEEATTAYHEAQGRLAELNSQMDANAARIADLERALPEQKARAAQSFRTLYKFDQSSNGLIDLVLSADDFNQMLATIQYLDIIQSKNVEEISRLTQLNDELNIARASIQAEQKEASDAVADAEQALKDAESAREAARQASLARSMEEEKQRQAALEASRARQGETFTTASGRQVVVEAPATQPVITAQPTQQSTSTNTSTSSSEKPAEQTQQEQKQETEQPQQQEQQEQQEQAAEPAQEETPASTPTVNARDQFIATWAPRIDAYNEGYPLGGYGSVFAAAAYDYGVDPRWSPAIARIESSSGLYCFADHNAWGWGSSDWPDWETAIKSHVSGLGRGYGYTLTYSAAATYCPPTADLWYSMVNSNMLSIWPTDQL